MKNEQGAQRLDARLGAQLRPDELHGDNRPRDEAEHDADCKKQLGVHHPLLHVSSASRATIHAPSVPIQFQLVVLRTSACAARRKSSAKSGSPTLRASTMPPTHRATSASARSCARGPLR